MGSAGPECTYDVVDNKLLSRTTAVFRTKRSIPTEAVTLHCVISSQVTFVEVSAHFLPDNCLGCSEFTALDHRQNKAVYEWVPSDQGPEVSLRELHGASCPGRLNRSRSAGARPSILGGFGAYRSTWSIRGEFRVTWPIERQPETSRNSGSWRGGVRLDFVPCTALLSHAQGESTRTCTQNVHTYARHARHSLIGCSLRPHHPIDSKIGGQHKLRTRPLSLSGTATVEAGLLLAVQRPGGDCRLPCPTSCRWCVSHVPHFKDTSNSSLNKTVHQQLDNPRLHFRR